MSDKLRDRLLEAIDIVETVEKLPPERITSREYGWLRDWLAAARATLAAPYPDAPEATPRLVKHLFDMHRTLARSRVDGILTPLGEGELKAIRRALDIWECEERDRTAAADKGGDAREPRSAPRGSVTPGAPVRSADAPEAGRPGAPEAGDILDRLEGPTYSYLTRALRSACAEEIRALRSGCGQAEAGWREAKRQIAMYEAMRASDKAEHEKTRTALSFAEMRIRDLTEREDARLADPVRASQVWDELTLQGILKAAAEAQTTEARAQALKDVADLLRGINAAASRACDRAPATPGTLHAEPRADEMKPGDLTHCPKCGAKTWWDPSGKSVCGECLGGATPSPAEGRATDAKEGSKP